MTDVASYAGLFCVAFAAATILPFQSEAVLVALLLSDAYSPWLLVGVASVGNVLGSVVNWLLGRSIECYRHRRWFPIAPTALERAQRWYGRYGRWSLLLSWLPVVGDPLTFAAGMMRERLASFLLLVSVAKIGRYVVLAGLAAGWPETRWAEDREARDRPTRVHGGRGWSWPAGFPAAEHDALRIAVGAEVGALGSDLAPLLPSLIAGVGCGCGP